MIQPAAVVNPQAAATTPIDTKRACIEVMPTYA